MGINRQSRLCSLNSLSLRSLSPSPSSEWCLPSPAMVTTAVAMAMEDTGEATMVDTVDTTARGLLMPSLRLRLMPSPLLPLSPATATTVTATDTATTVTPAPTPTDTTATTARGPLMPSPAMAVGTTARGPLMPSPDMVTTAEGTDTDMATDM